ncbi:alkane 1-monooxygenase [Gymnodinialimonas ulvae]|uniref:alkane 1-monooxygenase n=1 Tax=Gymnodinialimonas ulvae TaxID=3126504 RepID=UPI003096A1C3
MPVIARYAAVTLPPLALLILAGTAWGGFAWIALAWLTLVAALADRLLAPPTAPASNEDTQPWSDALSVGLALGHMLLLISTCAAVTSGTLSLGQTLALLFATASFFGQVSHPNAHELIHRHNTALKALGAAVYTTVGFGHHVSAHRLVHHRHVGTEQDPSTPRPGESFWAYLPRAWRGTFEAGIIAEVDRLEHKGRGPNHITNPYWLWLGGALVTAVVIITNAGLAGFVPLVLLWVLTGAQILMSDYVQHYGLQRLILPNGRTEPVAAHHSWNAPSGFSSYLMMNAPAHSEHHMHPDRPYDRLDPRATAPTLPFSMPVMAIIATVPAAWRRMMDKRALSVMEAAQAAHLAPTLTRSNAAPARTSSATPTSGPGTTPAQTPLSDDTDTELLLQSVRAATR